MEIIDWDTYKPFTAEQFVSQVRLWIDTKYHHAAAVRGVGADCTGILIGAARELGVDFGVDMAYGMEDRVALTQELFRRFFHELPPCAPNGDTALRHGDVLFFRARHIYHHVSVYATDTGRETMIHVYPAVGRAVEHDLDEHWRKVTLCIYRFRGFR